MSHYCAAMGRSRSTGQRQKLKECVKPAARGWNTIVGIPKGAIASPLVKGGMKPRLEVASFIARAAIGQMDLRVI